MKIAVYGKSFSDSVAVNIQQLITKLELAKCEVIIYQPFLEFLRRKIRVNRDIASFESYEDILKSKTELFLSIGGDGTFLNTIVFVRDSGIPVLGVNTGRLGFLASISKDDIFQAIDDVVAKKYITEKRSLIRLETRNNLFGDTNFALNEFTVLKKDTSSMITINMFLNDQYLNSYWADGLIIATPTGSTAYSLSCGGPIITPEAENFVITPIASHNLTVRPIVIPDSYEIKLKVDGRGENYLVSLDSRSQTIDYSTELVVRKESFYINLVRLESEKFFSTIRNKLMWGLDKRN
jgi:NAD+ kinase